MKTKTKTKPKSHQPKNRLGLRVGDGVLLGDAYSDDPYFKVIGTFDPDAELWRIIHFTPTRAYIRKLASNLRLAAELLPRHSWPVWARDDGRGRYWFEGFDTAHGRQWLRERLIRLPRGISDDEARARAARAINAMHPHGERVRYLQNELESAYQAQSDARLAALTGDASPEPSPTILRFSQTG
jgi:hypothetical protein